MEYEQIIKSIEKASHQAIEYLSNRSNLEKIGKITAISVATYVAADTLYDAFFGPLCKIPGPFWSRFIDFPKFIYNRPSGTSYKAILGFHDKYGDVIRLGPKLIAVADKEMIKQILVTDDFPKATIYEVFQKRGSHTLFSTTDSIWHKKRRRVVSPAFSIKYLNSLEPFMTTVTESLVHKIDSDIANDHDELNYGTVDIWNLVQRLALDVIGETAFGQTFHMVEDNSHFVPSAIGQEMKSSAISVMYPILSKFILPNGGKTDPRLQKFLTGVIEDRLHKTEGEKRKDILQFLIDVQHAADTDDSLTAESIMAETVLFLIAGSETTSNSIGFAIINLLRNPDKLKKLYEELDGVEREKGQMVFHHEQLKHLPYLNAVIQETLRVDSIAAAGLSRRAPTDTMLAGRVYVPKDTTVICSLYHVQKNDKYWPHAQEFRPERWIENEGQDEKNDLDAFFTFSAGSRNCIGKNFALQEMRIAIATLLKTFEIKAIDQEMEDAKDRRQFITLTVPKNSFNVKIKRRN
ncbi:cytochrome P450 [Parasitella parasitica]|nr:cytochrome P450 [Parasitella parasitica]